MSEVHESTKKTTPAKKGTQVLVDWKNHLGASKREDATPFDVVSSTDSGYMILRDGKQIYVTKARTFPMQDSL